MLMVTGLPSSSCPVVFVKDVPSPLLYVLYAEVLACNIRANSSISGLVLPGEPEPLPVISQYADDTTLVVVSD